MVLLGTEEPSVKAYLEEADVLKVLEAGVAAMLEKYMKPLPDGEKPNPTAFLAEFLKRNNPRHNPEYRTTPAATEGEQ